MARDLPLNHVVGILVTAAILPIGVGRSGAQASGSLPTPSGKHNVGRVSFHWVDPKRPEIATEAPDDKREIVAQVWYPAEKAGPKTGPYMPGVENLVSSAAADSLSHLFGPSWSSIASNDVRTHSVDNAPVAPGVRLPILIFSPGGGVPVVAYTTQIEDLASHGYVVIGVDPTYEAHGVVFPGGRVVTAAHDYWGRMRRQSASGEDFEKYLTDLSAADIRFVVDKLQNLEHEKASIFRSKLDLGRVGVFGHSRGGRTAARACQIDDRIKACLHQDGSMGWQPFWLDQSGRSLKQPFMMLDHLDPDPPEEAFAKMGTTRKEYVGRRSARQAEAREKWYGTIESGSYHVKIKTPGVSHNSFADIRLLGRPDGAGINAWPADIRAVTPNGQILKTISSWTRAFFDRTVRGIPGPLDELMHIRSSEVEILYYAPITR